MQEFAFLPVWPREDGIIAVQLRLGVHQAAAQRGAFLSDTCARGWLQLLAFLIGGVQDLVPAFPLGFSFLPLTTTDYSPGQDSQGNNNDKGSNDNIQHAPLTVAVAIPQLHLDEILHPKRITDTTFGKRVTVAVVRTVQLTCDGIDLQGSKYQKVCLLLPQFILEHCCHLIALEDLVGRLILNIKYHLGALLRVRLNLLHNDVGIQHPQEDPQSGG